MGFGNSPLQIIHYELMRYCLLIYGQFQGKIGFGKFQQKVGMQSTPPPPPPPTGWDKIPTFSVFINANGELIKANGELIWTIHEIKVNIIFYSGGTFPMSVVLSAQSVRSARSA